MQNPELFVDLIRHMESRMQEDMASAAVPFIGGRQNETPLSSFGREQGPRLGKYALQHDIHPTQFYCSPAVRSVDSHYLSAAAMGIEVDPVIDERLQELDQGGWTNQPRSLYDDPAIKQEVKLK